MEESQIPSDDQIRLMMFRAMEQMFLHSQASTKFVSDMNAKLSGVEAHTHTTVEAVDENENRLQTERVTAVQKELITHLFEKSHQYVTVVIAGAFAAYFATLGTLAQRFTDTELRLSALLMTVSLTVFVMWEVTQMFFIGHHTFKGDYGLLLDSPTWMKRGWYAVMLLTLGTALPAIGLSLFVYLRGLGVGRVVAQLICSL